MRIVERQNCRRSLDRLTAQRYLYRRAKGVENWRLASVVVGVSLLLLDFGVGAPWFSHAATVVVVMSWSVDQAFLLRWSSRLKGEAAAIQEDFDSYVLEMPWPEYCGVERPTEDRIKELSTKAGRIQAATEGLADWYGKSGIPAGPIQSRVHCQRANCRWDERLRKEWIVCVTAALAAVIGCVVVVAAFAGVSVLELVLAIAAGLRIFAWLAVEYREQSAGRQRMGKLHRYLSGDGRNDEMSMCDVRLVQAAIFDHRRSCPTVPDWFYGFRKDPHEKLERR